MELNIKIKRYNLKIEIIFVFKLQKLYTNDRKCNFESHIIHIIRF